MKRARVLTIALAVVFGLAATTFAQEKPKEQPKEAQAVNVTGTWDMSVETQQGTISVTCTFKQEEEKLTGTLASQMGETALEGSVKGNDIVFAIVFNMQGQDMTITYVGKIDGDAMSGSMEMGNFGTSTWTAQKRK